LHTSSKPDSRFALCHHFDTKKERSHGKNEKHNVRKLGNSLQANLSIKRTVAIFSETDPLFLPLVFLWQTHRRETFAGLDSVVPNHRKYRII